MAEIPTMGAEQSHGIKQMEAEKSYEQVINPLFGLLEEG